MEIPPAEIAYQEAHINDSQQKSVYAGVGIVTGLAVIFVVARIATRLRTKVPLKWDDHLIVIALVSRTRKGPLSPSPQFLRDGRASHQKYADDRIIRSGIS